MHRRARRLLAQPGPRHTADWYDQRGGGTVLDVGDCMLVACEGGPSSSRLEAFPPRLEVVEADGLYVLEAERIGRSPQPTRGDLAWKHLLPSRPTGNAATATTAHVTYPRTLLVDDGPVESWRYVFVPRTR